MDEYMPADCIVTAESSLAGAKRLFISEKIGEMGKVEELVSAFAPD
jgi:hypothetical protein